MVDSVDSRSYVGAPITTSSITSDCSNRQAKKRKLTLLMRQVLAASLFLPLVIANRNIFAAVAGASFQQKNFDIGSYVDKVEQLTKKYNSQQGAKATSVEYTHHRYYDNLTGCFQYASISHLFNSTVQGDRTQCAYAIMNPGRNLTLLKVVNSVSYLKKHKLGLDEFDQYARMNNYSLMAYVASNEDWNATGRPSFAKMRGIQAALKLSPPGGWAVFTDMDFLMNQVVPKTSLEKAITHAPAAASMIAQSQQDICSCLHLWRDSPWTQAFLEKWWQGGIKTKNILHTADQIIFEALLANRTIEEIPGQFSLKHVRKFSREAKASKDPNFHLTNEPLEYAGWQKERGNDLVALFFHTGGY